MLTLFSPSYILPVRVEFLSQLSVFGFKIGQHSFETLTFYLQSSVLVSDELKFFSVPVYLTPFFVSLVLQQLIAPDQFLNDPMQLANLPSLGYQLLVDCLFVSEQGLHDLLQSAHQVLLPNGGEDLPALLRTCV